MPPTNGQKLREIRRSQGVRVGEVADRAKVASKHLSNVECGASDLSWEAAHRVAAALAVSVESFLIEPAAGPAKTTAS